MTSQLMWRETHKPNNGLNPDVPVGKGVNVSYGKSRQINDVVDATVNGEPSLAMGVVVEYVWLDGQGKTRSKMRTCTRCPRSADDCMIWSFNGTPTEQAESREQSDCYLVPRKLFDCPVRGAPHKMLICEVITADMSPAKGNWRCWAAEVMEMYSHLDPVFGLEQEYICVDVHGKPCIMSTNDQDNMYCGRGAANMPDGLRELMGQHYAMCLSAGIKIHGMNIEQGPSQAEYQVGPCKGIDIGDHAIAARHVLHKAAENNGVCVSFNATEDGVSHGNSMHCNFSTKHTRAEGGLKFLEKIARVLGKRQSDCLAAFGAGNEKRLNGENNAPSKDHFKFAVSDRTASVRIPRSVGIVGKGYLEDRRPAANADPYRACAAVLLCAGEVFGKKKQQGVR